MKNYLWILIISIILLFSLSAISAENNNDSLLTQPVICDDTSSVSVDDASVNLDSSIDSSKCDVKSINSNDNEDYKTTTYLNQNKTTDMLKQNKNNNLNQNLSNVNKVKSDSSNKPLLTVSNSKIISSSEANTFLDTKKSSTYTYKDLYNLIRTANNKKVLKLTKNCVYNPKTDSGFKTGVRINKNIVIDGCGHYIDGRCVVKCIRICPNLKVSIKNFRIFSGYAKSNGAGIFLGRNSKLSLTKCTLRNHKVYNANGAAIYLNRGSAITIRSSFFKNNTSIRVSNKPWKKFKSGMGSAIKTTIGCSVKIYGSNFTRNKAYMSTILVVSYTEGKRKTSYLHIYNCIFANNTSFYSGVIYDDELGRASIINSVFRKNYSTKDSGIVNLDSSLSSRVKYCLFADNYGYNGGAITVRVFDKRFKSNVNIIGCKFIRNTAKTDGGAICAIYGNVHIRKSLFSRNRGKRLGGAIYTREGVLIVTKSSFLKNRARIGGAAYLQNRKAGFSRSSFKKNKATVKSKNVYSTRRVRYSRCKF